MVRGAFLLSNSPSPDILREARTVAEKQCKKGVKAGGWSNSLSCNSARLVEPADRLFESKERLEKTLIIQCFCSIFSSCSKLWLCCIFRYSIVYISLLKQCQTSTRASAQLLQDKEVALLTSASSVAVSLRHAGGEREHRTCTSLLAVR
jgi:hypothetical protein